MSEIISKVKAFGNSGHVIVPKSLIGKEVVVYAGKCAWVFRKMMENRKA